MLNTERFRDLRAGPKNPYKVTLRFRAPDRHSAAVCDVRCSQEINDGVRVRGVASATKVRTPCAR